MNSLQLIAIMLACCIHNDIACMDSDATSTLKSEVVQHNQQLSLDKKILEKERQCYELNRYVGRGGRAGVAPHSPITASLNKMIRSEEYAEVNQDLVQKIDREESCQCAKACLFGIITAWDFEHNLINYYARSLCEQRIQDARELSDRIKNLENKKNS